MTTTNGATTCILASNSSSSCSGIGQTDPPKRQVTALTTHGLTLYMGVYIYIYIRTHTHTHTRTYIYTHIYTYIYTYNIQHIYIYTYIHTHIYIYIHTQTCIYICIYIHVCIYICVYMYIKLRCRIFIYLVHLLKSQPDDLKASHELGQTLLAQLLKKLPLCVAFLAHAVELGETRAPVSLSAAVFSQHAEIWAHRQKNLFQLGNLKIQDKAGVSCML